jgi:hypothetical protein
MKCKHLEGPAKGLYSCQKRKLSFFKIEADMYCNDDCPAYEGMP